MYHGLTYHLLHGHHSMGCMESFEALVPGSMLELQLAHVHFVLFDMQLCLQNKASHSHTLACIAFVIFQAALY